MQVLSRFRDRNLGHETYLLVQQHEAELPDSDEKLSSINFSSQARAPTTNSPTRNGVQDANSSWYNLLSQDGWRSQMIRIAVGSTLLWALILTAYTVLCAKFSIHDGSGTLLTSTCRSVERANTGVHVGLNIIASLMLSASNSAMEALCCPDRKVVDAAHSKKTWLRIGGQSIRNFRFVSRGRLVLFMLLMITSTPLHLFFNAVFFTSSRTYQYSVAVVAPNFFNDTTWNPTTDNVHPSNFEALGAYTNHSNFEQVDDLALVSLLDDARSTNVASEFRVQSPRECMFSYAKGFVQNASDVVVVTKLRSNISNPLIWTRYPERTVGQDGQHINQDPYNWICYDALQDKALPEARTYSYCTIELVEELAEYIDQWTVHGEDVQYCLSRYRGDRCSLLFNVWLMLAVIFCGVVKTFVMIWICVRYSRSQDLRTFGDAVKSFLEQEDVATQNLCLVPSEMFVKQGLRPYEPQIFTKKQQRWWQSAGVKHFYTTLAVTILYAVLFSVALYFAVKGAAGGAFAFDFGQVDILALAELTANNVGSSEIVPNLLVANIPQLAFSFLYLLHNNIWTRINMAVDFDAYRNTAMGLRVSDVREGAQCGSRFFDLPLHWSLSIIATSAMLHWLTSQALFLVRIDGINNVGQVDPNDQLTRLGYNCRAIAALIGVLLVVVFVTVCIGCFRKSEVGPGDLGNSLVISAACHPPPETNVAKDMATKAVSWGDVTTARDIGIGEVRHASFAAGEPKKLSVGAYYA